MTKIQSDEQYDSAETEQSPRSGGPEMAFNVAPSSPCDSSGRDGRRSSSGRSPPRWRSGVVNGVTVHGFPNHRVKTHHASIEPRSPKAGEQTFVDRAVQLEIVHKTGANFYYLACKNPQREPPLSEQTLLSEDLENV